MEDENGTVEPQPDEGSEQQDLTLADTVKAQDGTPTVAQILRAGFERQRAERPEKDVRIPGYGEPETELHVLFRAIGDYEEVRGRLRRTLRKRGLRPAQQEEEIGLEMLALASTNSYAIVGGERHEIGLPLGLELYDYLFEDDGSARPGNDRQAIVLLFGGNTLTMMTAYAQLDRWLRQGGIEAEEELVGES